jgi:hypothetical protein
MIVTLCVVLAVVAAVGSYFVLKAKKSAVVSAPVAPQAPSTGQPPAEGGGGSLKN